jgi:ABC-type transport system involved in Fe-S cluster assembly fused permease/ATPase subunit
MEKLLDLFNERLEIKDMADAAPLKVTEGLIEFGILEIFIAIDSVTFQYDKRRETISNISFKIQPGTTTAFVGASGGGKTTIGRLLFRFYDPNEGSISIDGIDIRSVTLKSLREVIGIF